MKRLRDPYTGKEIWKLTDDPTVNHTHLYHNVDAFSGDGRYVAYGAGLPHFGDEPSGASTVHAYDLAEDVERGGHPGRDPVWNPRRPELVSSWEGTLHKWDPATDELTVLAEADGIVAGSVERHGRWALCFYSRRVGRSRIDRVAMDGSGRIETIYEASPEEFVMLPRANPMHDVCHVRRFGRGPGLKESPAGTPPGPGRLVPLNMMIMGTDGSNPHPVSTRREWHHHNWSGDGEWYMLGPYWKRWDAAPEVPWQAWGRMDGLNHQGHGGRDGRFIVGDFGNQFTYVYDLFNKEMHLMNAPMSSSVPYSKMSDPHAIGSPDGTKYVFDSMYNLQNAPVTTLVEPAWPGDKTLVVESTEGFPDRGHLVAGNITCGPEVVAYAARDATRFLHCRRGSLPAEAPPSYFSVGKAGDEPSMLVPGVAVVPYEGLHLAPGRSREPDVWVQVVRPPQHPRSVRAVRAADVVRVAWEAPDSHRELRAYRVWRCADAERWEPAGETNAPITAWQDDRPTDSPLLYAVSSVEHSGLESLRSATAAVASADGERLPPAVWLPAGDAACVPGTSASADDRLNERLDEDAYNHRSVCLRNGLGAMRYPFDCPRASPARIEVHAKSPADAGSQLAIRVNDRSFRIRVGSRDYAWIAATVDDHGAATAVPLARQNEITLSAPMAFVEVDQIKVSFCESGYREG